jgi:carboxyl-terminal processing protease
MIIKINGTGTESLSINQAVKLIRGPAGSEVILDIVRSNGSGNAPTFVTKKVIRQAITIPSLEHRTITTGGYIYGLIAINMFASDTESRLLTAIQDFKNQKLSGIIIDLRGNGGGLLDEANEIASHFVP